MGYIWRDDRTARYIIPPPPHSRAHSHSHAHVTVASVPYMTVVGNHENVDNFLPYKKRYNPPFAKGELYWSINYGALHLIGLSSETAYNIGSPQYNWLVADLAAIDRKATPWVVAGWHR